MTIWIIESFDQTIRCKSHGNKSVGWFFNALMVITTHGNIHLETNRAKECSPPILWHVYAHHNHYSSCETLCGDFVCKKFSLFWCLGNGRLHMPHLVFGNLGKFPNMVYASFEAKRHLLLAQSSPFVCQWAGNILTSSSFWGERLLFDDLGSL